MVFVKKVSLDLDNRIVILKQGLWNFCIQKVRFNWFYDIIEIKKQTAKECVLNFNVPYNLW